VAIYTGAKALSRWPINDESTLTSLRNTKYRKEDRSSRLPRLGVIVARNLLVPSTNQYTDLNEE
jgi:hypothetical protein